MGGVFIYFLYVMLSLFVAIVLLSRPTHSHPFPAPALSPFLSIFTLNLKEKDGANV